MLLTVKQTAQRLNISVALVYLLVASGTLPHVRLGASARRGVIRISESDLQSWVESLKQQKGQQAIKPTAPRIPNPRSRKLTGFVFLPPKT